MMKAKKIDIGGIQLYYEVSGESLTGPVIVFDSGYGWTTENWKPIQQEVSTISRMVTYDRAGLGKSSFDGRPRHSRQHVANLRSLLQKAEIKPPYLLIGHSFGGVNVRLYANTYPDEVAGVILLDSCHEDQNKLMAPLFSSRLKKEYFAQFTAEGSLAEFEESLEQVRNKSLGKIPLTVITGGDQPHHTVESWDFWLKFQRELAQLSTNSRHIILKNAGHGVHLDCPEAVIQQIKGMADTLKGEMKKK